jgi:hypothetical protein
MQAPIGKALTWGGNIVAFSKNGAIMNPGGNISISLQPPPTVRKPNNSIYPYSRRML